ncbi:MAG: dihydrofolate reductase family protein [Chloroflexi bacterium]|nr:dihydrofolate reductase family protein [Chloroflexota bacterium]
MRQVVASIFVSLDGVMEAPEQWTPDFWSDELETYARELLFASGALLLGRRTYEVFAKAWPKRTDEQGFADRINQMPKFIASTTLDSGEWNAEILKGEVATEVAKVKDQAGGSLLIYGSADLVNYLLQRNLIDEHRLWLFPVVVGAGKHLFKDGLEKKTLKHTGTTPFSSGTLVLTYEPA